MAIDRTQRRSRFLDLHALAALRNRRFTTRHTVEGLYGGRHMSRQRGGSGEFVDFRPYVGGEDLRRLDWKVLARTRRAYVRHYQDETNLPCMFVIDASGSMQFGSAGSPSAIGSKLTYVQYLATALSHVIFCQQDQVGLAVVNDGLQAYIPPGGTPEHVARVQEAIEVIKSNPVTDLSQALRDLFHRVRRRGLLLVMSDFLLDDLEETFGALRLFRHRHWEVVVLHIIHPGEERLPDGMAYRFDGMENDGHVECNPDPIRALYEKRFQDHVSAIRTVSLASGCGYHHVSMAVDYVQVLSRFLVERSG